MDLEQRQGFGADKNWKGPRMRPDPMFDWEHRSRSEESTRFGEPPAQPSHDNWGPLVIPTIATS